ncbi:hypothetical protein B0H11DRAFT_1914584 [Mycena galericulata]|nr:hypothetical protein B0H11DRAFT_1914584 [Mycena galericulata]
MARNVKGFCRRMDYRYLADLHMPTLTLLTRKHLVCSNVQCCAVGRKGHTIDKCFWPGGGKEGQWPSWWKGKRTGAPPAANVVETFVFTVWTVPEAVVSVYDGTGIQAVSFQGEEVLASPESLMAWSEAADTTVPVALPETFAGETSSNTYLANDSAGSFEVVDLASTSEFELIYDSDTDSLPALASFNGDDNSEDEEEDNDKPVVTGPPFAEACGAAQIAAEAFLQHGQPYLGDDHI